MKKKAPKIKGKIKGYALGTSANGIPGMSAADKATYDTLDVAGKADFLKTLGLGSGEDVGKKGVGAAGLIAPIAGVAAGALEKFGGDGNVTAKSTGVGALKGASTGASIGSIIPGVGTAVGAGVGAVVGGVGGFIKGKEQQGAMDAEQKAEEERKALEEKMMREAAAKASLNPWDVGYGMKEGGTVMSATKAKLILKEGKANGKALTTAQKKYFGMIAGGGVPSKALGGELGGEDKKTTKVLSHNKKQAAEKLKLGALIEADRKVLNDYLAKNKLTELPYEKVNELTPNFYTNWDRLGLTYKGVDGVGRVDIIKKPQGTNEYGTEGNVPASRAAYGKNFQTVPVPFYAGESIDAVIPSHNEGGEVKGVGTTKSDSIKAKVKPGSFVVPAENAHVAEMLRKVYLGKDTKTADVKQADGKRVNLSNKEHIFTPEEKNYLEGLGMNMSSLAPNAVDENNQAEGTPDDSFDFWKETEKEYDAKKLVGPTEEASKLLPKTTTTTGGTNKRSFELPKANRSYDLPTFLGLGQAVLGATQLLKQGARPVDQLDPEYAAAIAGSQARAGRAQKEAAFGLTPEERRLAESGIESNRQVDVANIVNQSGGSGGTALANIRQGSVGANDAITNLNVKDNLLRQQKQAYADQQANYVNSLIGRQAEMKRKLFEDKMGAFQQNQNAGAELVNAGLSNILAGDRLKNEKAFNEKLLEKQLLDRKMLSDAYLNYKP
ncbi:MAG: hypothetical protein IT212_07600 [Bacteroidia bacterium]|nr:hypothetical protein [Bacteroidia bacterium]